MSDAPSFLSSPDSLHPGDSDRNARLQLEALQTRLRTFEDALQTAIDAELQFRTEMADALNSLRMLIAEQRSEDARLTELVQQDTQRSREVMADYDNLASSFRENVQPPDPTRLRDAFRTVGIVLSFILMAPIQAIWWLLTQFITRLAFGTTLTTVFARLKGSSNASTAPSATVATARRATTPQAFGRHNQRSSVPSGSNVRNGSDLPLSSRFVAGSQSATQSPGTQTLPSSIANGLVELQTSSFRKPTDTNGDTSIDSEELEASDSSKLALRKDAAVSSSSDVFVDARTSSFGSDREANDGQDEDDSDTETSGEPDGRPAWALPLNSESALPDMANFPPAEFWHISDEEMKLDFNRVSNNLNNN
ncbi:hypothetical protein FGB62_16g231 [Gracilaria domingensis]|nr:hypothetical protein FGB62_16g231 [Gracilaria domingensis]